MTDEPAPSPPPPSTSAISLGMACSVMSFPVLLYSAHDIFFWLPRAHEVMQAVKVRSNFATEQFSLYGKYLWVLVAVSIAISLYEAFRRPGRPRTVRMQVFTFAGVVILAMLARHSVWAPFVTLLQGVGTEP